MKIAISATAPSLDAEVNPRFGRCQYFIIVDPDTMQFEALENSSAMASGGAGFAFTGHAFELAAYQGGVLQPGFTFSTPVTITIYYSDDDIRVVTDESELTLYWWTGSAWQDAAETCSPASTYVRDTSNNVLSVPVCHLSKFGLLGPTHNMYLPLVMRNG